MEGAYSINSAVVSLNRFQMCSMLPMFAVCKSARSFSRRAQSDSYWPWVLPPACGFYSTSYERFPKLADGLTADIPKYGAHPSSCYERRLNEKQNSPFAASFRRVQAGSTAFLAWPSLTLPPPNAFRLPYWILRFGKFFFVFGCRSVNFGLAHQIESADFQQPLA